MTVTVTAWAIGVLILQPFAMSAGQARAPFSPPDPTEASLDQAGIAEEYRRPIEIVGLNDDWDGEIKIGEARFRQGGIERVVSLLTPQQCFVIDCDGVVIEQRVGHRHHGASIMKRACVVAGSTEIYPYTVSISLLQSNRDHTGTKYMGCGRHQR